VKPTRNQQNLRWFLMFIDEAGTQTR